MTALNFPANPTNGQTYENYVYDGTDGVWKRISPGGTLGNIDDVTIDSPADGESLVYDSATGDWINADATVEVYGVDTAETDYFMIPVGGDADRPVTPANGHIRFNSDSGEPEWYSEASSSWVLFQNSVSNTAFSLEYLIIAGGGGGGTGDGMGGGGGAGGYRTNVVGETSGGGQSAEGSVSIYKSTYLVTVGAGGAGGASNSQKGSNGSDSSFLTITSYGGGGGGTGASGFSSGSNGGSGGGSGGSHSGGAGSPLYGGTQGYAGGARAGSVNGYAGGGGGGAGQVGQIQSSDSNGAQGGVGGNGLSNSITGTSITRGGGGGGSNYNGPNPGAAGGTGGGGRGSNNRTLDSNTNGEANTGGGGGGGGRVVESVFGKAGGSGVVIIKYPSSINLSSSEGLTELTSVVGDYKVTQFTAGTGTVTFS